MNKLALIEGCLMLVAAAVGTLFSVGPQALVNMVVYPVVGVALVLVVALGWERLANAWRRSSRRLRLLRANRARGALFQTLEKCGRSVG